MAAHAAPARRRSSKATPGTRGTHGSLGGWGLPATLGALYGLYAASVAHRGGDVTWGQALLGIICAVVLACAVYGLRRGQGRLPRELRAAAWAALAGIAIGFLFSLSHASVLSSTVLALVVAAGVFCAAFYVFYTHEDATGRPVRHG